MLNEEAERCVLLGGPLVRAVQGQAKQGGALVGQVPSEIHPFLEVSGGIAAEPLVVHGGVAAEVGVRLDLHLRFQRQREKRAGAGE